MTLLSARFRNKIDVKHDRNVSALQECHRPSEVLDENGIMAIEFQNLTVGAGSAVSGDLTAAEDVVIEGRVDGRITLPDHHLTIAAAAFVKAKIVARSVTIRGSVDGAILAGERVQVLAGASVRGHLTTPAILLADGAQFNGTVDPDRTETGMRVARYRERQRAD
jgi:cytoskeletal protein CcmA (bactofilin family)